MIQYARNLTDPENGFLKGGKRILVHDRDPLFTKKFCQTLRAGGVRALKLPKQSPNLNPWAERFILSIKSECLSKMILFGEGGVRHAVSNYVEYYLRERVHSALGRRIIQEGEPSPVNMEASPNAVAASSAAVPNVVAMVPGAAAVPGAEAPPVSPPKSRPVVPVTIDEIRCRERLGGLLKSYYRQAA